MFFSNWPAQREQLPTILNQIKTEALREGLSVSLADRLELALEELLVNIMDHSLQGSGDVRLQLKPTEDGFVVETTDHGIPWGGEMTEPDLDAPLAEREIGGLGLFMMEQLVERVAYERRDDCNVWQLYLVT